MKKEFTRGHGQTHASPAAKTPSDDRASSTVRRADPTGARAVSGTFLERAGNLTTEAQRHGEGIDDKEPGLRALVCDFAVFGSYAIAVACGLMWDWVKREVSVRWTRFVFRLVTHVDCCRCKKRMHRAPLHFKRPMWNGGPRVEHVSHTYCVGCREAMLKEFAHDGGVESAVSSDGFSNRTSLAAGHCEPCHRGNF